MQAANERRRTWCLDPRLLYAQVVRRYRRHVLLGQPKAFGQTLISAGFSGRVQTAYIEPPTLNVRRSLASLARRSWTLRAAHAAQDLVLQCDWWRAVYHFVKPHHSLRQKIDSPSARLRYTCPNCGAGACRARTPAQAVGLTRRRWSAEGGTSPLSSTALGGCVDNRILPGKSFAHASD